MNGWIAAAMWGAGFVVLGALALCMVSYLSDHAVEPWPGVR